MCLCVVCFFVLECARLILRVLMYLCACVFVSECVCACVCLCVCM